MIFKSISIENFGPYYGENYIDLSKSNGVTLFWGNNGRGKTVLLNAFRFALYGEIKGRDNEPIDYTKMINIDGSSEGKNFFIVSLEMESNNDVFLLTRKFKVKDGSKKPYQKDDYELETFLNMNGSILSHDQKEFYIKTLLPMDISRFFLFDGELLQEYETLLSDDKYAGDKIKDSIEKILGLPLLTEALKHSKVFSKVIETNKLKAIQQDAKAEKFSGIYQSYVTAIAEHQHQIDDANNEILKLKIELQEYESKKKDTDKIRGHLDNIEKAKQAKKTAEQLRNIAIENIKAVSSEAWKYLLKTKVDDLKNEINIEISNLQKKQSQHTETNAIYSLLLEAKKALNCDCPICSQKITPSAYEEICKKIDSFSVEEVLTADEQRTLSELQSRFYTLDHLTMVDYSIQIQNAESQIDTQTINIANQDAKIAASEAALDLINYNGTDDEEIRQYPVKAYKCQQKIDNFEKQIENEKELMKKDIASRDDFQAKINSVSGNETKVWTEREKLCNDICSIFSEGVVRFRDKLKKKVEDDATNLFVQLSSDKDYIGLRINDNYGLFIVHKDGREVPMRSAGFEHLVALSLIGALHQNAPLKGPIIMDSPFGRLDPDNKQNVSNVLPKLADQVLLLMYNEEISSQNLRETLSTKLVKEYKLNKITSFRTEIVEG